MLPPWFINLCAGMVRRVLLQELVFAALCGMQQRTCISHECDQVVSRRWHAARGEMFVGLVLEG